MVKRYYQYGLAVVLALGLISTMATADAKHGQHDDHPHKGKKAVATDARDDHGHHGTHRHLGWETPPPEYAGKRSTRWTDAAAITRGKPIFQTNCLSCHGTDGRGTGPQPRGCSIPRPT